MLTKNTSNCWFDAEKMLDFHASLFRATFHSVCHIFFHSLSRFRLHARALILDQQHFFIHNAYDTYVFIGHTSIRNDKNDNDLHQLYVCVCVCRRLTKQKFKYHLRLKWKAGWQQQQHHHCCHNVFVMKNMRWNGMVQQIELKMEYAVWIIDTVFLWPRYFFFINASFLWHLLSPNCLEMRGNGIALWNTHANLVWWTFRFYNNRVE